MRLFIFSLLTLSLSNFAQTIWKQTNGPYGGEITYVSSHDTILYSGTQQGSIYKSTNGGEFWVCIRNGHNTNHTTIGTQGMVNTPGGALFVGVSDGGLLKTIDSGETWTSLGKPAGFLYLTHDTSKLILIPGGSTNNFVYTTDLGSSWVTVTIPNTIYIKQFASTYENDIWMLASYGGPLISSDGGSSWIQRHSGITTSEIQSVFINNNRESYVGTSKGLFYSNDFGLNWIAKNTGIPFSTKVYDIKEINDSLMMLGTSNGAFLSCDQGNTWQSVSTFLDNRTVPSLCSINDTIVLFGSRVGTYFWKNSECVRKCEGINSVEIMTLNGENEQIFAGTEAGLFLTTDQGENWRYIDNPRPVVSAISIDSNVIYAAYGTSGIFFRSMDGGVTWGEVPAEGCCTKMITFSNHYISVGLYKYYGYNPPKAGVRVSNDYGNSWFGASLEVYYYVTALGKDSTNRLYIGTYTLDVSPGARDLFISDSYGLNPVKRNNGLSDKIINFIASDGQNVYLATEAGVYLSTNRGDSWNLLTLQDTVVSSIQADKLGNLYLNNTDNLFKYNTTSGSLTNFNSGLENRTLSQLYYSGDNYLYVGTDRGVFKTIDTLSTQYLPDQLPSLSIKLMQNYPNPFNPTTTFIYSIPEYSDVTLKVFDILGNEIETLVNEEKPAGIYELTWTADNLSSGVYFYQLNAGEFTETKKIILMK